MGGEGKRHSFPDWDIRVKGSSILLKGGRYYSIYPWCEPHPPPLVLDISLNKLSKVDRRLLESLASLRRLNLAQGGSS